MKLKKAPNMSKIAANPFGLIIETKNPEDKITTPKIIEKIE
ncbi:MAG: hypothetical protein QXX38_02645 [Candidatus Aenigmatarchaeota archaeon]